jgi:tetratricopeptide (TPR) repeat protein
MRLNQEQFHRFNNALVDQITPHLKALSLDDALVKFTGDGWLVIAPDSAKLVPSLCCLALIMSKRFAEEMADKTGLPATRIPKLRVGIESGADVEVRLPNGNADWVGDSVRNSVRASNYCEPNEVLIGHTAWKMVFRDFVLEELPWAELSKRPVKKQSKQNLSLCRLNGIKEEPGENSAYVHTLKIIGMHKAAAKTTKRIIAALVVETTKIPKTALPRSSSSVIKWNRLIAAQTYDEALVTLDQMKAAGLLPDVVTYSTLINLAKDYAEGKKLLKQMRKDRVPPNVVTYNTLINLAKDYATGEKLLKQMREDGVPPNVVTYNTLINLAKDYATGEKLLKQMREDGVPPNVVTYNTLINLAKDYATGEKLLKQMREDDLLPDVFTYNTLINLAKDYATGEKLLIQMRADGVPPDVVTYSTLINLAKDYATGEKLLIQMRTDGVPPNVVTYTTLFSKDVGDRSADEILRWYLGEPSHPETAIAALITQYRSKRRNDQALRIALDYPHNEAVIKFIRNFADEAIKYFKIVWNHDPNHPNAAYALGIALMEAGKDSEAKRYLQEAMRLAKSPSRQSDIRKRLARVSL